MFNRVAFVYTRENASRPILHVSPAAPNVRPG